MEVIIDNLLIVHGGAPTAVINSSLYGIIEESRVSGKIKHVLGVIGGIEGIIKENLVDLLAYPETETHRLLQTPGSALGTSRFVLNDEDYDLLAQKLKQHDVRFVLMNGGNGTMDAAGKLERACRNLNVSVVGVPKTIDNDIAITDHAPGYASAAGFIASSVAKITCDVDALSIHVSVIETMGRNVGWIAAASALARKYPGDSPDLIYTPERAFSEEEFLEDVSHLSKTKPGLIVVVSEGLKNKQGELVVPPIFGIGRSIYPSYVGMHLSNLIITELGIKSRYEKPGLLERTQILDLPNQDRSESIAVGRAAVRAALDGRSGVMIGIKRLSSEPYEIEMSHIPLHEVMLVEKQLPQEWINQRGNDVTSEFLNWCKPLIGNKFGEFLDFKEKHRN